MKEGSDLNDVSDEELYFAYLLHAHAQGYGASKPPKNFRDLLEERALSNWLRYWDSAKWTYSRIVQ